MLIGYSIYAVVHFPLNGYLFKKKEQVGSEKDSFPICYCSGGICDTIRFYKGRIVCPLHEIAFL